MVDLNKWIELCESFDENVVDPDMVKNDAVHYFQSVLQYLEANDPVFGEIKEKFDQLKKTGVNFNFDTELVAIDNKINELYNQIALLTKKLYNTDLK